MSKNGIEIDIATIILKKLEEKERTIRWLSQKIDENESNLRKRLKNSRFIYFDLVYKISKALEEDFFDYGSQKLKEKQKSANFTENVGEICR